MSSVEEAELKGGHPPAEKVAGMRVARPHHNQAEAKPEPKKDDEEFEPSPPAVNPHTQEVLVSGVTVKEEQAFTPEAVKHFHDKPMPTREVKHSQPKHHIQQPRS